MTGYTVHTGATEKFVAGWDRIFQQGGAGKKPGTAATGKKAAKKSVKKSPKKSVGKSTSKSARKSSR